MFCLRTFLGVLNGVRGAAETPVATAPAAEAGKRGTLGSEEERTSPPPIMEAASPWSVGSDRLRLLARRQRQDSCAADGTSSAREGAGPGTRGERAPIRLAGAVAAAAADEEEAREKSTLAKWWWCWWRAKAAARAEEAAAAAADAAGGGISEKRRPSGWARS